jgi:PTS system N-acetylglucosamine-specific IIC component
VVVGPVADQLASEIRVALRKPGLMAPATVPPSPVDAAVLAQVLKALGGRENIAELRLSSTRLCIAVRSDSGVDEPALRQAVRAVARPARGSVHLVIGPQAGAWFAGLKDS